MSDTATTGTTTATDQVIGHEMPSLDPKDLLRGYHGRSMVRAAAAWADGVGYGWVRAMTRTPAENWVDATRWWGQVLGRRRPRWASEHRIVFETPIARLRDFTDPDDDPTDVVPTLVLPPQAGHDSCIVDFAPGQSQLAAIRDAGLTRAFSLDWVGATQATSRTTIEDYIAVVDRAVDHARGHVGPGTQRSGEHADRGGRPVGKVNVIGDCQGGWLAAIYAALHPEKVNTLTLAGAPIDFHTGQGAIGATTQATDDALGQLPYRAAVAAGGGNMPGAFVLGGFVALRPDAEIAKHVDLARRLDDPEAMHRYAVFEDWFKHTQDIAGTFYLWLVEHLFTRNELIAGTLEVGGRRVDLGAISCPLFLLGGSSDHITPPAQVFAAAEYVATPARDVTRRTAPGGHLGLFMGRQALHEEWPPLLTAVRTHS